MKKFLCLLLSTVLLSGFATNVYAYEDYDTDVSIFIDGEILEMDTKPIIVNDRTLVPIRAISEKMNYTVGWDEEHELVSITNNQNIIFLKIGSRLLHVNDVEHEIDVAPLIHESRTYVPLRFVTETLNCNVDWDGETYSVLISSNGLVKYNVFQDENIEFSYPDTWILNSFGNINDFDINNNQATGFLIKENKKEKTIEEYAETIETKIQEIYFGEGDIEKTETKDVEYNQISGKQKYFAYKSIYATVFGLKVKLLIFEVADKFYTFGFFSDEYSFTNYSNQIEKIFENINLI